MCGHVLRTGLFLYFRMNERQVILGIVGCGCIGGAVARAADAGRVPLVVGAVCDVDSDCAQALAEELQSSPEVCSLEDVAERADIVMEAAGGPAVRGVVEACIDAGTDVLVMSVGGLLGCQDLFDKARDAGVRIELPSGALAALDAVRAAREGEIKSVTLVTKKPPAGLRGAPYLAVKGVDVDSMTTPVAIFEGTATDAVQAFPKNVNVAAALSFAGIGPEKTRVRVVADPMAETNSHEIIIEADCGRIVARTENLPSPDNPRTSHLAVLSALSGLRRLAVEQKRIWRRQCTQ